MTVLRRLITLFLLTKLAVLIGNVFRFPVLRSASPSVPEETSLLVPVRNEGAALATRLPAILDQSATEAIVLDDESTDSSRDRIAGLVASRQRARAVSGRPAPTGWVGKTWACHQLSTLASGSVLIFCDADVELAVGALDAVLAEMRRQRADVLSVFPQQLTASVGEHLITPLIDDALLCFLPFALLSMDVPAAATANGSLLVFTRAAYDRIGGFEAVRGELVEDVAIARRVRRAGLKLGLVLGGDQVRTRMYAGYRPTVVGLGRGLPSVVGGRRPLLVLGLVWHLLAYTLPWPLAAHQRRWIVPVVLGLIERLLVEAKTGRWQLWQSLLTPLSPLAAVSVVAQSLRRRQTWKGRVYA